jgi:hypothetical protein
MRNSDRVTAHRGVPESHSTLARVASLVVPAQLTHGSNCLSNSVVRPSTLVTMAASWRFLSLHLPARQSSQYALPLLRRRKFTTLCAIVIGIPFSAFPSHESAHRDIPRVFDANCGGVRLNKVSIALAHFDCDVAHLTWIKTQAHGKLDSPAHRARWPFAQRDRDERAIYGDKKSKSQTPARFNLFRPECSKDFGYGFRS